MSRSWTITRRTALQGLGTALALPIGIGDELILAGIQTGHQAAQGARILIGDRVPIATGSIGNPLGGVLNSTAGLVNTQFQYLDVGVNIDVTPNVHANGDVTLKVAMDISSVTGTSNIGGISQPVIGQRKIE